MPSLVVFGRPFACKVVIDVRGAVMDGAEDLILDVGAREDDALLCDADELFAGKTPALPAQSVQGHPMLSPSLSIKY